MSDNASIFRSEILARLGAAPDEIVAGAVRRFATKPNGRDDCGWYTFYDDGFPAGAFGNWRTGEKFTWRARETRDMSHAERQRLAELKIERAKKIEADAIKAAASAMARWINATPSKGGHAYLDKKNVEPHGIREAHGCLLVPVYRDGDLVSIQTIDANGEKLFAKGTRVEGGSYTIGAPSNVLIICEGFATGATLHEATGRYVVVAFNAGNLLPVAKRMREKFPEASIIVAADDDFKTEKERGFNPGMREAKKAAEAIRGTVAAPPFMRDNDSDGATDWNDFGAVRSNIAVATAFKTIVDTAEISRLATLNPIDYDRARKAAAKSLGVRTSTLDKQISAKREEVAGKVAADLCRDVEPYAGPVNIAELLDTIRATIARFIVCDPSTATATTLWIAFTWIIDHVQVSPLAIITAPEKRCGKTQLLDLIGRLSKRNLFASNISPAATFRVIEAKSPTLLIDEADSFFKENEELRGIINSGHTRTSAYVIRTVGDDFEVKQFSTWGAKAIAGIGKLSDTIMDRAIVLPLRRKHSSDKVERLRHAEPGLFDMLARKLARFGTDHGEAIGRARPHLPDALGDRAQDNWEPLLAIADLAGGDWPKEARRVALAISGDGKDDMSINEELLSDIRGIFDADGAGRIALTELLKRLCDDDTAPWSTWSRGKPMTTRQLGKRLGEFGISAKTIHLSSYEKPKGFHKDQFADAWARYLDGQTDGYTLPPATPVLPVTRSPIKDSGACEVTKTVTGEKPLGHQCARSPSAEKVTDGKSDRTGFVRSPVRSPENPMFSRQGDRVTDGTPLPAKEGSIETTAPQWSIRI